jgi:ubiquinone/menaquinone biosynthesis C-methylase UbiE
MLEAGLRAVERRSLDSKVQLVQGRAEHLPFPDETFDTKTLMQQYGSCLGY